MANERMRAASLGLSSAALFGAGAPLAKMLLPRSGPLALAGLLYLGAGVAFLFVRRSRREARLAREDAPALVGAVLAGAAIAPPLMLWGLARVSGLTGSLLLNLEAPFTMAFAVLLFGEHLSPREALAAALALAGGALVGARGEQGFYASAPGALAIALACAFWAIDNNLNARLALKDPVQVLRIKMLSAGALNLTAGLLVSQRPQDALVAGQALVLGSLSYGASFLFYLRAQRTLGAARQAALFAVAPFAGALLSLVLLHDRPRLADGFGAALMATGVAILLRARHGHQHAHEAQIHDHLHHHDEHHRHAHEGPVEEPHSHAHRHEPITHAHPHASDAHHRHRH